MNTVTHKGTTCIVQFARYSNGRIALQLVEAETQIPYARCTINDPSLRKLEEGHVLIKDYSENEGIYQSLLDAGIVLPKIREVKVGYALAYVCPVNPELDK